MSTYSGTWGNIAFVCLIFMSISPISSGSFLRKKLKCWRCVDSTSDAQCFKTGEWIECGPSQHCYVEQRYENGIEIHKRGCKQDTACRSLAGQNHFQCSNFLFKKFVGRFKSKVPVTCRHCCDKSFCNPTQTAKITMGKLKRKSPPRPFIPKAPRTTPSTTTTKAMPPVVPLIPGKQVNLGEVFYPRVGWVSLSQVKNQRPPPGPVYADDPSQLNRGNVSEEIYEFMHPPVEELLVKKQERIKKWKEGCTNAKNPVLPPPENFNPKEECVIQPATSCIEDGTLVFRLYKLEKENKNKGNTSDDDEECLPTPSVDTAVVYDNEDHYIMVVRLKQRYGTQLPIKKRRQYFIGDERLAGVVTRKEIHRYRAGKG
ncbi:uncharacterized protein LOC120339030 [Styela clava]